MLPYTWPSPIFPRITLNMAECVISTDKFGAFFLGLSIRRFAEGMFSAVSNLDRLE
jgi:hypothetical protein